jgi:Suppressor of fused protein (SUFU)
VQDIDDLKQRKDFVKDIRRSIILSKYIYYWGLPKYRLISNRGDKTIEIYSFPPTTGTKIYRFGTVGVSSLAHINGDLVDYEFMLALPKSLGNSTEQEVFEFIMDMVACSLELNIPFQEGTMIPKTSLTPKEWKTRAILVDTPRAEAEDLETFMVGNQKISLYWLIPIYGDEYDFLLRNGLEIFDKLCEKSDFSLADINRPSLCKNKEPL